MPLSVVKKNAAVPNSRVETLKNLSLVICLLLLPVTSSCTKNEPVARSQDQNSSEVRLPTGATSAPEPEDGQWLMAGKNYASTRFSGLDEINSGNVANLKVAWKAFNSRRKAVGTLKSPVESEGIIASKLTAG